MVFSKDMDNLKINCLNCQIIALWKYEWQYSDQFIFCSQLLHLRFVVGIKREATPNSSEEERLYHFHELNCLKYFNIYNSVPDAKRNWCRSHQGGFVTKKRLLKKGEIGLFNIWYYVPNWLQNQWFGIRTEHLENMLVIEFQLGAIKDINLGIATHLFKDLYQEFWCRIDLLWLKYKVSLQWFVK